MGSVMKMVYHSSRKGELNRKLIYECQRKLGVLFIMNQVLFCLSLIDKARAKDKTYI
jgi:hypothetical protein